MCMDKQVQYNVLRSEFEIFFFVCVSAVGNVFKIGSLDNCPVHNEYEKKPKDATEHPS